MKHSVSHDLSKEMAVKVSKKAFEAYQAKFAKYNPTSNWVSDSKCTIGFTAKGINIDGALEVYDNRIDMDLEVPFLLRPFKGKALSLIEGEIKEWVAKAKAGELD